MLTKCMHCDQEFDYWQTPQPGQKFNVRALCPNCKETTTVKKEKRKEPKKVPNKEK